MNIFGIISFLLGCFLTFVGYSSSLSAKNATTGGWGGPKERYVDYDALHTARIITLIGVALIIVGIIFFLIKFINKKPNNKNTKKCLKCGNIVNREQTFCSKCGNNLQAQYNSAQPQTINIDKK